MTRWDMKIETIQAFLFLDWIDEDWWMVLNGI
jgi:hypothetical protein